LPVGHPDNPYNAQNLAARLYLTDFAVSDRGRGSDYDNDTWRVVAGLKGFNWDWDWDIGGMYAKTEQDISRYGFYSKTALEQAIAGQGGFGYYRVGGSSGLNNPGIWNFVSPTLNNNTSTSVTSFDAKTTRQWQNAPLGPLGVALGAEWRREEIDSPPTPGTATGDVIGLGYSAANGSRDVTAVYAEMNWMLHKTVELDLALRYDDYSDYGSTVNPKVGLRWQPVKEVLLRGTWATGFRAPNAYENGNSATTAFTTYTDPVRCPITDAAVDCGSGQLAAVTSGNRSSTPRRPDSYTLGAVWEPVRGVDRHRLTGTSVTTRSPRRCRRRSSNNRRSSGGAAQSQSDRRTAGHPNSGRSCRCTRRTPTRTSPRPTASTSTPAISGPTQGAWVASTSA
jgi:iron complex outermembrane receptor protein